MSTHPNVRSRGFSGNESSRILVFAPDATVESWVEHELAGLPMMRQLARSVRDIVAALVKDPPPLPQILIADVDAMSAADVLQLYAIREQGWFGTIIMLGTVAEDLRRSLNVEHVLSRPLADGLLRTAVEAVGLDRATTKMTKLTH